MLFATPQLEYGLLYGLQVAGLSLMFTREKMTTTSWNFGDSGDRVRVNISRAGYDYRQ